jgi:metal-sulfur cluster biosynthetic enzyme
MTLTSPNCPVAEDIPIWVENALLSIDGIDSVRINITWDPPWNPDMMSTRAKIETGFI